MCEMQFKRKGLGLGLGLEHRPEFAAYLLIFYQACHGWLVLLGGLHH